MSHFISRTGALKRVPVVSLSPCSLRAGEPVASPGRLATTSYDEHDPLLAYRDADGHLVVVDGLRRLAHALAAGVEEVDVFDLGSLPDEDVLDLVLRTGLTHAERNRFEVAVLLRQFVKLHPDLTTSRAKAERIGCSHTHIIRAEELLGLPEEVIDLGRAGKLRPGDGRRLLRVTDVAKQLEFAGRLASPEKGDARSARQDLAALVASHNQGGGSTDDAGIGDDAWRRLVQPFEALADRVLPADRRTFLADDLRRIADRLAGPTAAASEGVAHAS